MNRTTLTSLMTSGLVVSLVALSAAGGALAQTSGGHGGKGGGIGSTGGGGGGGSERVIVCTGCADPNAFIEDGVLKGGGMTAAPIVTHVPRTPNNPNRRRPPAAYQANEACYLKQDLLPDGRMVIYRDCGEVIRTYR
jgi:hypothetical protein